MRRKFGGQTVGGFKAPVFIRREGLARASDRGQADRSLIFHFSILFSGRGRADESFFAIDWERRIFPIPDGDGLPSRKTRTAVFKSAGQPLPILVMMDMLGGKKCCRTWSA
jgi:hypothetical protein